MVSKIIVLILVVGSASAATWLARNPQKPKEFAHLEGCYVKEINDVVPFGTTLTPIGYCYRIQCDEGYMDYASCGAVGTDDRKCHVTDEDLRKPYPACCSTVKCDLDNNLF